MKAKVRVVIVIALSLAAFGAALASYAHQHKAIPVAATVKSQPTVSVSPKVPTSAPDPLSIAAIRGRMYPGSAIIVEQNLGEQGGYSSQVVSYQSDGLKINALLDTPDGSAPSGGWPAIVFNHGYIIPSRYSTTSSYKTWEAALSKAGFVVLKPDYRGNDGSQGDPEGGHFSPVYAYDVLNAVASIKQYPAVNPRRIGMFGHSMGGHEALRAIVTSSDIKATVIAAGAILYLWGPKQTGVAIAPSVGLDGGGSLAVVSKW